MKLRFSIPTYFTLYYFLLLFLYHFKIKTYFYWEHVATLKESAFGFSTSRFLLATGVFFVNLFFVKKTKKTKLAFIVLSIFFLLLTVPSLIAYTSGHIYPVKLLVYHQLFFFALYLFSRIKIDFDKIPLLNKAQSLNLLIVITTIGLIPYLLVYGPHINLKNLVLLDVYQTRNVMANLSNPYFGYTYSLFTKIIVPLIIVFALELKKKGGVILGVLYLILFYLFGAHKTVYVGLIVVLVFYRFTYAQTIKKILKYSNILIVLSAVLALFNFDYLWILSFRRIHFLPTLLDISYLDFFTEKPLYWSESVLRSFIDYPYELRHENLIGEQYFNRADMAANNGLVSDGLMNFGAFGVLINVCLVSTYFMVLNGLNISSRYFGLFLLVIFSFISSSVSIVLITHGAFVLLLIALFMLRRQKSEVI